jgi:hypothetical protein
VRNLSIDLVGLLWVSFLDELSRHTAPYFVWTNLRIFQYQRTCSHNGTFTYYHTIQ